MRESPAKFRIWDRSRESVDCAILISDHIKRIPWTVFHDVHRHKRRACIEIAPGCLFGRIVEREEDIHYYSSAVQ
jgi:hypothetical protein